MIRATMVKPAHRRTERYKKGLDPNLIGRKFKALRDVMIDLETPYLAQIAEIERKVKRICEPLGVQTFEIAQYINYARQLYSKCKKFSGVTLTNEAQYLTTHWVSRGLLCSILILIAKLFGITVTCVPTPSINPYFFEFRAGYRIVSFYAVDGLPELNTDLWAGSMVAQFFPVFRRTTFDRLGIKCTGALGGVNDRVRLAVYDSDGNLHPNNLILETAPFKPNVAWGWNDQVIDLTLDRGMHFLAWQANCDVIGLVYFDQKVSPYAIDPANNAWRFICGFARDIVYQPFPDPFGPIDWKDWWYYGLGMRCSALP